MTTLEVVLLIAAVWLSIGTAVVVLWNLVKYEYLRRGGRGVLEATAADARLLMGHDGSHGSVPDVSRGRR